MRATVRLGPIVAALVLGCASYGETDLEEEDLEVWADWDDIVAALDGGRELTDAACESLCLGEVRPLRHDRAFVDDVHGCRFEDDYVLPEPLPGEQETTAGSDTAPHSGSPAPNPPYIVCTVTGTTDSDACGRHHVSVAGRTAGAGDAVGRHLADAALAEATSVRAFRELARELDAHGAPDLAEACRSAALDEIAHARVVAGWARARGARMGRATFRPTPARDLLALAVENAVEGCVNETYAALVAAHQSVHAAPELRAGYARIAADEARHADLAWAIDGRALGRLDAHGRATVEAARAAAIEALFARVADPDPAVAAVVGLPSAAEARRLLDGLVDRLWAPLAA